MELCLSLAKLQLVSSRNWLLLQVLEERKKAKNKKIKGSLWISKHKVQTMYLRTFSRKLTRAEIQDFVQGMNNNNAHTLKITQTDYKQWHNAIAKIIHWDICKNYHVPVIKDWWEHIVEKMSILWGFWIQVDKVS